MHDVVVALPRVVEAEHLAPRDEDHDDDEAEVVEARKVDEPGEQQDRGRGDEDRDGPPGEAPDDTTADEEDAIDVERIANDARPVSEEQLLPREAPRLGGDLGGQGSGHFSLRSLSCAEATSSSRCPLALTSRPP